MMQGTVNRRAVVKILKLRGPWAYSGMRPGHIYEAEEMRPGHWIFVNHPSVGFNHAPNLETEEPDYEFVE